MPRATSTINYKNQQTLLLFSVSLPFILTTLVCLVALNISPYLIAFISIVVVLILAFAVFATRTNIDNQQQTITNLLSALIEEDYSLRGNLKKEAGHQPILNMLNQLANNLQQKTLQVREKQLLLDKILAQMKAMLFAYNENNQVVMANEAAKARLFQTTELSQICLQNFQWLRQPEKQDSSVIQLHQGELQGEFFVFRDSFISEGQPQQLVLIIKAEQILREQQQQAWQDLLRVLSHELNNSLTPIATISRSLHKKVQQSEFSEQKHFEQGLAIVSERANSLQSFITSYRELAQLPAPNKSQVLLSDLMHSVLPLFEQPIKMSQTSAELQGNTRLFIDKKQIQQVLINLIKNAIEANAQTQKSEINIECSLQANNLQINIRDQGPGIANFDNLFVPFYTTKTKGNGLGLSLSRQITVNHRGQLVLQNHPEGGAEAIIKIPVTNTVGNTQTTAFL